MNMTRLAFKDMSGNAFRSWIIFACALLVAGIALAAVLIVRGADDSVRLTQQRLGADIVVVSEDAARSTEGALLLGYLTQVRLPLATVQQVEAVPGVTGVSPQLYLATIPGSPDSAAPDLFLVAYDPATDFTIEPWLEKAADNGQSSGGLGLGEALGGAFVSVPEGIGKMALFGYDLELLGNLEPTGTALDHSILISLETARAMAQLPGMPTQQGAGVPGEGVSSVMVKVTPGADPLEVAAAIKKSVPGVSPINSPDLFGSFRDQMQGQRTGMLAILGVVLALSLAIIVLIFSMAVNERRREIGVLRALGATRAGVLRSLLTGAAVLALGGGIAGIVLSGLILYFFRNKLISSFGFPFLFPSLPTFLLLVAIGLAVALAGVMLAAFVPAYRISRQEPAVSMRE